MPGDALDAFRQLETIRGIMERARSYRHPPAPAGVVAGLSAAAASHVTHGALPASDQAAWNAIYLAWIAAFLTSLAAVVAFTARAARREGIAFWSPLARDVVHSLWPPLVAGLALTPPLLEIGKPELVAAVWLLGYGCGGIAAGAYAHPIVRGLGVAFLAAGLLQLWNRWPPAIVLGATFGGLHLLYAGLALLTPRARE